MARWFILTSLMATTALADATAVARDAFMKGQSLYAAAKYKDALAKFEESFAARPHPATVFNIARCQDQLGDLVRAMTSYKEYLRQSPQATDADEVATAIASIEQRLQKQGTQHLLVYVDPATARVSVDGKDIGSSPASATITPGSHKVTIAAPGFDSYERAFAMSATRSMELTVSLRASAVVAVKQPDPVKPPDAREPDLTPPPPPALIDTPTPAPRKRLFTWVAAGTAGVAAGLGIAFTAVMKGNESQLKMLDPNRTRDQATTLYTGAYSMGTAATVSFITAGVAAAAAVVLFLLEGA